MRLGTVLRQLFGVACKPDFCIADIFHISSSICVGERRRKKGKGWGDKQGRAVPDSISKQGEENSPAEDFLCFTWGSC